MIILQASSATNAPRTKQEIRLSRYPTNQEWEDFARQGPGARMYNGKMTLFYDGGKLWEGDGSNYDGNPLIYDYEERQTWEVIIILPGVEVIHDHTFNYCWDVETVIMADTV